MPSHFLPMVGAKCGAARRSGTAGSATAVRLRSHAVLWSYRCIVSVGSNRAPRVLHKRMSGALEIHTYEVSAANAYFTSAAFSWDGPRLGASSQTARYWNVRASSSLGEPFCLRLGEARCGVAIEGTLRQLRSLQVFTVLHTEQHGVGISLTGGSDVFTPNGIFSEGIRPMPPPAPPVPPPTPRPSDAPTQMPTATPTDAPQFPETHPPSGVPTATPRDPPVSITGARSSCCPCARRPADARPMSGFVKSALNGQGVGGVTLMFTSGPNRGKTVRGVVGMREHRLDSKTHGVAHWAYFAGAVGRRRIVHVLSA